MLKILFTGCLGRSPTVSAQFTVEMCVTARNREKFIKTFWLFKVIDVDSFKRLVIWVYYNKHHIYAYRQLLSV